MNEIVRRHYPASRLPEDLRVDLPPDSTVEIRIVPEMPAGPRIKLADLVGKGENVHGNEEEVLRWIREGREDRQP